MADKLRTVMGCMTAALVAASSWFMAPSVRAEQLDGDTLYLFNWSDYIPSDLVGEFEKTYKVKVVQSYYNSNSELLAKLQIGGDNQYDVVVPSGSYLANLIGPGLLQKLDKSEIPNARNLADRYKDPSYDPGDTYSMPYQTGTAGVVYSKDAFKDAPDSWSILFDPKVNQSYPFGLMGEDGRDVMAAACAYLGYGFDCTKQDQWIAAAKLIRETAQRPNFTGFYDGDPAMDQYKSGNVKAAMVYNGKFETCRSDGSCPNAVYMLPKEGTELWTDTMAIPAHAPHPKLANAFINFILDAHSGAALSNYNNYISPNEASSSELKPALRAIDTATAPDIAKRLVLLPTLTPEQYKIFNQIWTNVRK